MLAVAYTIRLEDLARDVHAHTVAAAMAAAFGIQPTGGDRADFGTAKALFDEMLAAPPEGEDGRDDSARGIKLRALGVA